MRLIVEAPPAISSPSIDQGACDHSDQAMRLALFIQRMIARPGAGGAAPCLPVGTLHLSGSLI